MRTLILFTAAWTINLSCLTPAVAETTQPAGTSKLRLEGGDLGLEGRTLAVEIQKLDREIAHLDRRVERSRSEAMVVRALPNPTYSAVGTAEALTSALEAQREELAQQRQELSARTQVSR